MSEIASLRFGQLLYSGLIQTGAVGAATQAIISSLSVWFALVLLLSGAGECTYRSGAPTAASCDLLPAAAGCSCQPVVTHIRSRQELGCMLLQTFQFACRTQLKNTAGALEGCGPKHSLHSLISSGVQPAGLCPAEAPQQPIWKRHAAGHSKRAMDQGPCRAQSVCRGDEVTIQCERWVDVHAMVPCLRMQKQTAARTKRGFMSASAPLTLALLPPEPCCCMHTAAGGSPGSQQCSAHQCVGRQGHKRPHHKGSAA